MKLVLGVTGASGSIYAFRMLSVLSELGIDVSLIVTKAAHKVALYETGESLEDLASKLSISVYDIDNLFAAPSSGSYIIDAFIVLPCSMGSLSRFANGISSNLLERVFDVSLKEDRKIILSPRETPLSTIHLKNMLSLAQEKVIIAPLSTAFYTKPKSISDIVDFHIGKVLNLLKIKHNLLKEWPFTDA